MAAFYHHFRLYRPSRATLAHVLVNQRFLLRRPSWTEWVWFYRYRLCYYAYLALVALRLIALGVLSHQRHQQQQQQHQEKETEELELEPTELLDQLLRMDAVIGSTLGTYTQHYPSLPIFTAPWLMRTFYFDYITFMAPNWYVWHELIHTMMTTNGEHFFTRNPHLLRPKLSGLNNAQQGSVMLNPLRYFAPFLTTFRVLFQNSKAVKIHFGPRLGHLPHLSDETRARGALFTLAWEKCLELTLQPLSALVIAATMVENQFKIITSGGKYPVWVQVASSVDAALLGFTLWSTFQQMFFVAHCTSLGCTLYGLHLRELNRSLTTLVKVGQAERRQQLGSRQNKLSHRFRNTNRWLLGGELTNHIDRDRRDSNATTTTTTTFTTTFTQQRYSSSSWRRTLIVESLARYRTDHEVMFRDAIITNRQVVSSSVFWDIGSVIPISVYLITLAANSPGMSTRTRLHIVAVLAVIANLIAFVTVPLITSIEYLHAGTKSLYAAQFLLGSGGAGEATTHWIVSAKLKLLAYYERLHTDQRICFTFGSYGRFTRRTVFEAMIIYSVYLMFGFKAFADGDGPESESYR